MSRIHSLVLSSILFSALALTACGSEGGPIQILNMEPRNGAMQTQTPVKITGHNFRTDIGYTVFFGTQASPQVTIIDPETLVVVAPQVDEEGSVDVTVRADDGQAFRIVSAFEYQDVGGNVVEQLGGGNMVERGSLAY